MKDLRYEHLSEELLAVVPELKNAYEIEAAKWEQGKIPPHIAYGSLLADFVRKVVSDPSNPTVQTRRGIILRCFDLIEGLSSSSIDEVRNVIEVSVLESLLGQTKGDWALFSPYFGKSTLVLARQLAARWNIEVPPQRRR
ncbi:hypothetical protein EON80_14335 [bacterium]|nr:MAG: hypothetical protein EON80_14335 [bacterium]